MITQEEKLCVLEYCRRVRGAVADLRLVMLGEHAISVQEAGTIPDILGEAQQYLSHLLLREVMTHQGHSLLQVKQG